ncbi:hypothetical protein Patl1_24396 [Pistacia atlantica]|uniref:Uncharacterized protein n=1 Tax=Pistacia atlantica TaxID=434234 RepID=A0ACC1A103_9ROSI|nr:hypothetical protein Patl1_24396 [Pistacia atlantica]
MHYRRMLRFRPNGKSLAYENGGGRRGGHEIIDVSTDFDDDYGSDSEDNVEKEEEEKEEETVEEALDVIATLKQRGKRICGNDVCSILCLERFWIQLAEHLTLQDEMEGKWPGMVIFSEELGHRANPLTKNQTRLTGGVGATVWF